MQPMYCYNGLSGNSKEDYNLPWARNRPLTLGTEFAGDHSFLKPFSTKLPGFLPSTCIQQKAEDHDDMKHEEFSFRFLSGLVPSRQKSKRFSMTYVALIASAILRFPDKRLTLAQIYQVIEKTFPEFTVSRAGWKNTVRHNLSLHECFVKGDVAANGKSCYWHIHPAYMARFSKGDFRKRPSRELCMLDEYRSFPRGRLDRIQHYPSPYMFGAANTARFEFPCVGERHLSASQKTLFSGFAGSAQKPCGNPAVHPSTEWLNEYKKTIFSGSTSSTQKPCGNPAVHSSTEWLNEYKPYPYYYLFSQRNSSLNPQPTEYLRAEKSTCSSHELASLK